MFSVRSVVAELALSGLFGDRIAIILRCITVHPNAPARPARMNGRARSNAVVIRGTCWALSYIVLKS